MNALEIKNLRKHYPTFSLNDISLTLPMGCVMGFIGENGAGKSTTINLILDLIRRDSGSIQILGRDTAGGLPPELKEQIWRISMPLWPPPTAPGPGNGSAAMERNSL